MLITFESSTIKDSMDQAQNHIQNPEHIQSPQRNTGQLQMTTATEVTAILLESLLLTMLTSEMESMLAILMLIPTMTGGPAAKRDKKEHLLFTILYIPMFIQK